jgi:hypothetical protein
VGSFLISGAGTGAGGALAGRGAGGSSFLFHMLILSGLQKIYEIEKTVYCLMNYNFLVSV